MQKVMRQIEVEGTVEEGGADVKHSGKRVRKWWWQHGKPKDLKEIVLECMLYQI